MKNSNFWVPKANLAPTRLQKSFSPTKYIGFALQVVVYAYELSGKEFYRFSEAEKMILALTESHLTDIWLY